MFVSRVCRLRSRRTTRKWSSLLVRTLPWCDRAATSTSTCAETTSAGAPAGALATTSLGVSAWGKLLLASSPQQRWCARPPPRAGRNAPPRDNGVSLDGEVEGVEDLLPGAGADADDDVGLGLAEVRRHL